MPNNAYNEQNIVILEGLNGGQKKDPECILGQPIQKVFII